MFFNSDYKDLMPDHPESDEDPSFFGILGRSCGTLLKANLLFLLGCVPVISIPISLFAMNRIIRQVVRDRSVQCGQMFKETFRRYWRQSFSAFLLTAVPLVCAGYGMWFYLSRVASLILFFLPFLVCSTIFLATLLSSGCLYGLLDSGKDLKESLRLALLLGVVKPLKTVPAALLGYGLPLLAVLCLPLSGLYLLLIGFSLPCMIGNFILRTLLKQYSDEADGSDPAGQAGI